MLSYKVEVVTAAEAYELTTQGGATDLTALLSAQAPRSDLRIQFTTDERYQVFLTRAVESEVLGIRVGIASLEDVTQGKLWAFSDPRRRLSKRKKDELDLIRLAEAYPELKSCYPAELQAQLDRG